MSDIWCVCLVAKHQLIYINTFCIVRTPVSISNLHRNILVCVTTWGLLWYLQLLTFHIDSINLWVYSGNLLIWLFFVDNILRFPSNVTNPRTRADCDRVHVDYRQTTIALHYQACSWSVHPIWPVCILLTTESPSLRLAELYTWGLNVFRHLLERSATLIHSRLALLEPCLKKLLVNISSIETDLFNTWVLDQYLWTPLLSSYSINRWIEVVLAISQKWSILRRHDIFSSVLLMILTLDEHSTSVHPINEVILGLENIDLCISWASHLVMLLRRILTVQVLLSIM